MRLQLAVAAALAAGSLLMVGLGVATAGPAVTHVAADCVITQSRSVEGKTTTSIRFINETSGTVAIYWLNYNGERVLYNKLAAGTSYDQPTWNTHPWVALDAAGTCIGYTVAPIFEYRITEDKPVPPPVAFAITRLVVPKAVVGGRRRADLKVFWQGSPVFPVRVDVSKAGCKSKSSCKGARKTFKASASPLVWKQAWYCQATKAGYRVATDVSLTDANGLRTPKLRTTLTCKAR